MIDVGTEKMHPTWNVIFTSRFFEAINELSPGVMAAISLGKASDCRLLACSVIAR
ncbi:MAG: hypothetical protein ACXWMJ_10550 [Syntrophales bacterium]